MKLQPGNHRLIVNLQLFWQYALLGWFALVTVMLIMKSDWASGLAVVGVGLIVAATVTVVSGLAWQFKKSGYTRGAWLCGILLALLGLAVLLSFVHV